MSAEIYKYQWGFTNIGRVYKCQCGFISVWSLEILVGIYKYQWGFINVSGNL